MPQIRGRVGGLMVLSDTGNQVVCMAGQTDGHNILDHTTRRARHLVDQFGTSGYPINASQWPHRVCVGPVWLDRVGKSHL